MDRRAGDAGATGIGWVVALAVAGSAGLLAVDAVSVGTCLMTGSDLASSAALAASSTYEQTGSADRAYAEAVRTVHATDAAAAVPAASFTVAPDGSVRLGVRRAARTFLLHRVAALRDLAVVTPSGSASAAP